MKAVGIGATWAVAGLCLAGGSLVRADYAEDVLADDPIAYWRLGEEQGAITAADAGANRIGGTYSGIAELEEDGLIEDDDDTAVRFNGLDTEVRIPDHTLINTGGPYESRTIELWFRAEEFFPGAVSMLYEEGGATRGLNMFLQEDFDGALQIFMTGWNLAEESWGPVVVNEEIELDEVYHAVMVLESSQDDIFGNFDGRITAYLNGEEIGTEEGPDRLYAHGDDSAIGGIHVNTLLPDLTNPGDGGNFTGVIDEVALYDYALDDPDGDKDLSDSRVLSHYVSGTNQISPCFTADRTEGSAPLTVNFDAACTTAKLAIESYRWEFSDGQTAEGQMVTHEFKTGGPHLATLVVRVSNGLTSTTSQAIRVICDVPEFSESDVGEAPIPGGGCATDRCIDIWGSGGGFVTSGDDVFFFIHKDATGNVIIRAQVREATIPASGVAGLMLRGGLEDDSAFVFVGIRRVATSPVVINRLENGGRVRSRANAFELVPPDAFLQLERRGTEVVASASTDGVQFTELQTHVLTDPGQTLLAGVTVHASRALETEVTRAAFCDIEIQAGPVEPGGFRRGDCNADGILTVADPIANLAHQFLGQTAPCVDACDFNDNGLIELSDPISNLAHQFLGGDPPAPPGIASCGPDPMQEEPELGCLSFLACQ